MPVGRARRSTARRRDVLTHLAARHREATLPQLVVQLGGDQMDLAEVRLGRIARDP